MKKTVIIGANSYIARSLIETMRQERHPDPALYDLAPEQCGGGADYRQLDILDPASFDEIDLRADHIYLFSGKTGTSAGFDEYESFIRVNETGLLNLLTAYRKQGSKAKIIFPSTRLVYRGGEEPLGEDAEKEFRTVYAMNKYACERYLAMYQNMFGVNYLVFRICVPYGNAAGGASYGTVGSFLNCAANGRDIPVYGTGEQRRTFTHIADLCRIMIAGAEDGRCMNGAFNVGGETLSIYGAAKKIADKYGVSVKSVPWREEDLRLESGSTVFDSGKLDGILGCGYAHGFDSWLNSLDLS